MPAGACSLPTSQAKLQTLAVMWCSSILRIHRERVPACGQMVWHFPLSQRVFRCACGYVADRDENAARNILQLGQSCWVRSSTLVGLAQEAAPL